MADAQLACRRQLDHIAAVDVHHATKFRNDDIQKTVQVDRRGQGSREAINDPLTRLVHFDLAF